MNEEKKMTVEEFTEDIRNRLQEYYKDEYRVNTNVVTKNNDSVRHGVSILKEGGDIAPNIYLDEEYERYLDGKSMSEIMTDVIMIRSKCRDNSDFEADCFGDYEWVKDRLGIKLVSKELNSRQLKDIPHVDFADMTVVFTVELESDSIGSGFVTVRNEHTDIWGVKTSVLYRDALSSMKRRQPPYMADIVSVIEELLELKGTGCGQEDEDVRSIPDCIRDGCPAYVLTNRDKLNGASVIVYPEMLHDIGETLGCDYYVIPSSIHEVLLIPESEEDGRGYELTELVREVNRTKLSPEEILSDHAYRYHRESNWLEPVCELKSVRRVC